MTTTTTNEVELYYERVRAALGGLDPEIRDDLLDDLPDHLAEVLAEGEGSLLDRLGEPEAYAEELCTAAGVEVAPAGRGYREVLDRVAEVVRRFDARAGRLVGYPRLMDLFRAVRPGWWILRGWIVAQFVSGTHDRSSWHGFIPSIGGNQAMGFVCTVALIIASVWLGQRSLRFADWPRRLMIAASAVIAVWAVFLLANNAGGTSSGYGGFVDDPYSGFPSVTDVYVYDKDGNAVDQARLFDQDGNPIQVGDGYCEDGQPARATDPETVGVWIYPLCPGVPGPFRSGPGALPTPAGSAAPSASPSNSPSAGPTGRSTTKPSAKASRTH